MRNEGLLDKEYTMEQDHRALKEFIFGGMTHIFEGITVLHRFVAHVPRVQGTQDVTHKPR